MEIIIDDLSDEKVILFLEDHLKHIIGFARKSGYEKIYLETGSYKAFEPARKLYEKFGFQYCGAFSNYQESPNIVYMVKDIR